MQSTVSNTVEEDIAKAQVYEHWYDLLQDGVLVEPNMQICATGKTFQELHDDVYKEWYEYFKKEIKESEETTNDRK